jgi:16S rRNA (cytosine967-C5)-methyltransferase
MTPAARVQAAIELIDQIIEAARGNGAAADTIIAQGMKARRYAGSKDRRAIRDLVYEVIRAHGACPADGRSAMLALPHTHILFDGSGHGPAPIGAADKIGAPLPIADWLRPLLPQEELESARHRAPLDLRVNSLKATCAEVCALLAEAEAIDGLPNGLRLSENITLADRPELAGMVEVQDAGSQFIVAACAARPDDVVIDFCAGAGGKTLALAADMQNQGRLIASDTDRTRLSRLTPRAERAGASCIETRLLNPKQEHATLHDLEGMADIVLVDAPCSGTGTWRRNPELRWRLTEKKLAQVTDIQAHILETAQRYVKPGGRLVYAVCSLLDREGADQVAAFLARNAGWTAIFETHPDKGRVQGPGRMLTSFADGTDGFFFATLARNC